MNKPSTMLFHARVGKRRAFATTQQAVAYERGFAAHPIEPWGLPDSSAMQGFLDADPTQIDEAPVHDRRESDFAELSI